MVRKFFLFLLIYGCFSGKAQSLEWKVMPIPDFAHSLLQQEGYIDQFHRSLHGGDKSFLIFQTNQKLLFESSFNPKLEQPRALTVKSLPDGYFIYVLIVKAEAQKITFVLGDDYQRISFNQPQEGARSLPALKPNDLRFFEITSNEKLEWFNITEREKQRGGIGQPIGPNVSDALIFIKTQPSGLKLDIRSENELISKIVQSERGYGVFIKFGGEKVKSFNLSLFEEDSNETSVLVDRLSAKEERYYLVKKSIETLNNLPNTKIDPLVSSKVSEDLIGTWSGSVNRNLFHLVIRSVEFELNRISGIAYRDSIMYEVTGVFKQMSGSVTYLLSLETKLDQRIGSMGNFSLDLNLKGGRILDGYLFHGEKNVDELTLLKNSRNVAFNDGVKRQDYISTQKAVVGKYSFRTDNSDVFKHILITDFYSDNVMKGLVITSKNEVCAFYSRLTEGRDGNSTNVFFDKSCGFIPVSNINILLNNQGILKANYQVKNASKRDVVLIRSNDLALAYKDLMPSRYKLIAGNISSLLLPVLQGVDGGQLNLDYIFSFSERGQLQSSSFIDYANKNVSVDLQNRLNEMPVDPPIINNIYLRTKDTLRVSSSWSTIYSDLKFNSKSDLPEFKKKNMPFGKYELVSKFLSVNGKDYKEQYVIGYRSPGPGSALASFILPGSGTRIVSSHERNGWGRFFMTVLPILGSIGAESLSRSYYDVYLAHSFNANLASSNYDLANMWRRISLVSAGVGLASWSYEIIWVFNRGIKNKRESAIFRKQLKESGRYYLSSLPNALF